MWRHWFGEKYQTFPTLFYFTYWAGVPLQNPELTNMSRLVREVVLEIAESDSQVGLPDKMCCREGAACSSPPPG